MRQLQSLKSKLVWIRNGVTWRIKRNAPRAIEKVSSFVWRILTGHSKIESDIKRFANDLGVVSSIHPEDHIYRFLVEDAGFATNAKAANYYFYNGANSARKLNDLLFSRLGLNRVSETSLLEFASGYGCVTRHLKKSLAPINIVSCDIHPEACSFIESEIGIRTAISTNTPEDLKIENNAFDAVFALSFFSHMPDDTWGRWIKSLFEKLKPGGFLIFTTQGMISRKHFGNPVIPSSGIWFTSNSEQKDLEIAEYGNAIVTPEYVSNTIKSVLHQGIFYMAEAAWWEHQDLYVVRKPHE